VRGDARLLRRLVRNLLENAVRHGAGTIEAGVACDAARPRLWVADRGPGVPVAEQERIFEPFYRSASAAADATPGVGLGLALVRQIAACHGGQASCRAREGGGTLFEVVLGGGKGGDPGGPPPTSHAQK
jgi:signal transduction histidine kinase